MRRGFFALAVTLAGFVALWLVAGSERGGGRSEARAGPSFETVAHEREPSTPLQAPEQSPEPAPEPAEVSSTPSTPQGTVAGVARERVAARTVSDDLVVRVVDPAGNAVAGLPIHLERPQPPQGPGHETNELTKTTDTSGRARFAGLRAALRKAEKPWHLWHEVCFESPPRLELGPDLLDLEEVLSVQPWFGSIVVRVWEPDGTLAMDGLEVELALRRAEERVDGELALDRPGWRGMLSGSEALFSFVELGRDWMASAWHFDPDARTLVGGPGPRARGQEALLEVRMGADRPVFVFRAIDEHGQAFDGVELELEDSGFLSRRRNVSTDQAGFFRIDGMPGNQSARRFLGGGSYLVRLEQPDGQRLGRAAPPETNESGQVNAGDVVLAVAPLLAAGRVVDEAGRAVAGAKIAAGAHSLDENSFWDGPGFETTSAPDGSFELRGLLPEEEFSIRAAGHGLRSEDETVHEGRRDLVLVLRGRHAVSGRLLTEEGLNPGAVTVRMRPAGTPDEVGGLESIQSDGLFVMGRVPAGWYDLEFTLGESVLERRAGIEVREDLWIGEVDLRGTLSRLTVLFLGDEAESVAGEIAWRPSVSSGGTADWHSEKFHGPSAALETCAGPLDVWARPEGYRAVLFEDVIGRCQVRLQSALLVRLDLVTSGKIPGPPYVFDPVLQLEGVTVAKALGPRFYANENRSLVFEVAQAGSLQVGWHLERRGDSFSIGGEVLQGHEVEIEVLDVAREQRFEIALDGAALDALTSQPPW